MIGLSYSASGTAYTWRCIALGVAPGTLPGGPSGTVPDNSQAGRYGGVGPVTDSGAASSRTSGADFAGLEKLYVKSKFEKNDDHKDNSKESFSDLIAKFAR